MTTADNNVWILHPASTHPNKNTFSTNWYHKHTKIVDLPVFTGFFRVGNHYLIDLIENYFGANVWTDGLSRPNNCICFWTHDHDHCLRCTTKSLFLYRKNVYHVMYSLYKSQFSETEKYNLSIEDFLKYRINDYKFTLNKWLQDATVTIVYEKLLREPESEFSKVVRFFNQEFDNEKFEKVRKLVTPQYTNNRWKRRYPAYFMHKNPEYYSSRNEWIEKYSALIKELFLNETYVMNEKVNKFIVL